MQNIYFAYLGGLVTPIVLALLAKAIRRTPQDLKAFLNVLTGFIRN